MDESSTPNKCHLLELPGELRNRIYRFALVNEGVIIVTAAGPSEPALLRCNKEIRQEAVTIYYRENKFKYQVRNFNGSASIPFMAQLKTHCASKNATFKMFGRRDWDNMVAWVKASWMKGESFPKMNLTPAGHPDHHLIGGMFDIVHSMEGLPWENVEKALAGFYYALRVTDSPWVKYGDRVRF